MAILPLPEPIRPEPIRPDVPARSSGILSRLLRRPLAAFGLLTILAMATLAIVAPIVAPYGPAEQLFEGLTPEGAPLPPNAQFLAGTDLLGRDLLSRLLYGARTSLIIGVVANGIAVALGALVGITAGFFRGWVATILMRFTDLMMAFPALLLAIVLAAIFRPSLWIVALVIALVNWVQVARIIFTETRSLAEREFIDAERAIGAGPRPHPVPPYPAAPRADDHRLGHARHLHDGVAGGDAQLPWHRRSAADPRHGATSSTRTRPTSPPRPGWSSFPAPASSCWRWPSTSSATRCATCSIRPRGGATRWPAISSAGCCSR
jgi:hypothetical protein